LQFPERRGKPSVLNYCVAAAQGDVLAFSDANTFWGPDALKKLVQRLDDARVGGVCGQLILTDPQTGANIDGAYWKYENFLKHCEGAIGALLGFNGAIYVLRRACWQALPPQTIVDDFLIGMRVYLCGRTLAFEESALAHEESAPSLKAEFHRRARIGAGGFQSLVWLLPLLSPRYGRLAWAFWSHKLLRWCCPLFLAAAFAANVALSRQTPYGWLLVAQASFYGLAFAGRELRSAGPAAKGLKLASMFVGMNAALAVGFWRWAARQQSGAWRRTERSLEAPARGELTRV
jgi:cellulose synthase/poly-beta-1,6-N-acetylglucosamine synthase-like glycosyltransferase